MSKNRRENTKISPITFRINRNKRKSVKENTLKVGKFDVTKIDQRSRELHITKDKKSVYKMKKVNWRNNVPLTYNLSNVEFTPQFEIKECVSTAFICVSTNYRLLCQIIKVKKRFQNNT